MRRRSTLIVSYSRERELRTELSGTTITYRYNLKITHAEFLGYDVIQDYGF